MSITRLTATALTLLALACPLVADEPAPYDGYRVVRVAVPTLADWDALDTLGLDVFAAGADGATADVLVSPAQADELTRRGLQYEVLIPDVQTRIDAEAARLATALPALRGVDWFTEFRDLATIETYCDELVAAYPQLVTKQVIGYSYELRPIYALTLSAAADPNANPAVCFNGGAHAREWIGPMTVMYIADRLLDEYDSDPNVNDLLHRLTVYIVPVANPDGYVYTWTAQRLWRKTRRPNGDGSYGVDWNRNWDAGWGTSGTSFNPSDITYCGTAPFSEPETQVFRDFLLNHPNIAGHIDFHSYSQLVLRPFGYQYETPAEPANTILKWGGDAMAAAIQSVHGKSYASQRAIDLYACGGTCMDWGYETAGIYAWSIELRDTGWYGFLLPPEQIIPTGEENYAAIRVVTDYFGYPVEITFPAGLPTTLTPNTPYDLAVRITAGNGVLETNSPTLHWRRAGEAEFTTTTLRLIGGEDFIAPLPAVACGPDVEYYVSAAARDGTVVQMPAGAPAVTYAASVPCPGVPGDANCDGAVDFFDIDAFVAALTGEAAWQSFLTNSGYATDCPYSNNDANGDGGVDFFDIDPFVTLLTR